MIPAPIIHLFAQVFNELRFPGFFPAQPQPPILAPSAMKELLFSSTWGKSGRERVCNFSKINKGAIIDLLVHLERLLVVLGGEWRVEGPKVRKRLGGEGGVLR